MSQIPTDATEVTTLEFAVSPEMEEHENGHDLTGREGGFTVAVFFSRKRREGGFPSLPAQIPYQIHL